MAFTSEMHAEKISLLMLPAKKAPMPRVRELLGLHSPPKSMRDEYGPLAIRQFCRSIKAYQIFTRINPAYFQKFLIAKWYFVATGVCYRF